MLCPDCKTKVPDKYTYCPKCGASIPLYRTEQQGFNRFVPVICSMLAIGTLGTVAYLSGIRNQEKLTQSTLSVEEKPAAQSAAPEESTAPVNSAAPKQAAAPAEGVIPETPAFPEDSAIILDQIASLYSDSYIQKGDIDADGYVTAADAQLVLSDYADRLSGRGGFLTDEQRDRAALTGNPNELTAADAQLILRYYAACLSDPSLREAGIVAWCSNQEVI